MQVKLKYRLYRDNDYHIAMETWAGDQFERLTKVEFEQLSQAIAVVNKHFTNAILFDDKTSDYYDVHCINT